MREIQPGYDELAHRCHEAEAQLEKLQLLYDHAPLPYQSLDAEGRLLDVNPAWLSALGYTRDEVIGTWFGDYLHPDYQEHFRVNFPEFKQRGAIQGIEFVMRRKDGGEIHVSFDGRIWYTPDGQFRQTYCIFKDVTAQKKVEAVLRDSEQRYRLVAENGSDVIWLFDLAANRFTYVSPSVERLRGYSVEEVLQQSLQEVLTAESYRMVVELLPQHLARLAAGDESARTTTHEMEQLRRDGASDPIEVVATLITDAEGRVTHIQGISRDITERKRVEAALQESESRFRSLFRNAPVGIFYSTADGKIIRVNAEYARILGYASPKEVKRTFNNSSLGERIYDNPDERAELVHRAQETAGCWLKVEQKYRRKDGTHAIANLVLRALPDNPTLLEGFIEDITERKLAEKALTESAANLSATLNATADGILAVGTQGQVLFYNQLFAQLWDIPQAIMDSGDDNTLLSHILLQLSDPDAFAKKVQRLYASDENSYDTLHFKDGRVFARYSFPMRQAGLHSGRVWSFRDITDRTRTEEALRLSEDKFHKAFHISPDSININRLADGVYLEINEGFTTLTGYTAEEVIGRSSVPGDLNIWVNLEDRQRLMDGLRKDGEMTGLEAPFRCKDGSIRTCLMSARLIELNGEQCLLSITRDITERKQTELERDKLQAQLAQAQKMESVGRLAGGVAHDFNNMLGVILGNAEMAMTQLDPTNPLYADLSEIIQAAHRSANLTRQLLAFARKQTVSPKILDLNETITDMLKMLRRLIGEDIDMAWLPGTGVWPVNIDPAQVDQILANLCVNARDAITGVGKVTIETANMFCDEAYCAGHAGVTPGAYVLLAVSDNGCGMDQDIQSHLFEPFFTTKAAGEGTGLGLATIYGVVKQNHGFINVYSEPGQGTTFKIYLPRHMDHTVRVIERSAPELNRHGQETVLLVEDELSILNLCKRILHQNGYQVLTANTPCEAIKLAEEYAGEIHLLLTDVVMPDMNGRDLAKRLHTIYPELKRLFMSGYTADVIAHHSILDEGINFLQKPFTIDDLAAKVREVLDQ